MCDSLTKWELVHWTGGPFSTQGWTEDREMARSPERRLSDRARWLMSQGTKERHVEYWRAHPLKALDQVKDGTHGKRVLSEVGEAHIKEIRDHVKVTAMGISERSTVLLEHDYEITLFSPRVLKEELIAHVKVPCKRGVCIEDPIALDVGHEPFVDSVMETSGSKLSLGHHEGDLRSASSRFEGLNFRDMSAIPVLAPPDGFKWQFLEVVWALVLRSVPPNAGGSSGADVAIEEEGTDARSIDVLALDIGSESNESMLKLMSELNGGTESLLIRQALGIRKSKRQKKPLL